MVCNLLEKQDKNLKYNQRYNLLKSKQDYNGYYLAMNYFEYEK